MGAALAMFLVGTLTAVSGAISAYPLLGGQAVRYAVAAAALWVVVRRSRLAPVRVRAREWAQLAVLAATGLALFNVCVVGATRETSAAAVGTVIATVPVVLAVAAPMLRGGRPARTVLTGAVVVTGGAALSAGLGGGSVRGLLFALGALAGEVCFSLLAVPLLPRLGPLRVSAYTATLATPMLLVAGIAVDGADVLRVPTAAEAAGLGYLALIVTTVAFVLWYDALGRIGADRAGLFAGIVPVSAVLTAALLGQGAPTAAEAAGAVLVTAGVLLGLSPGRRTLGAALEEEGVRV